MVDKVHVEGLDAFLAKVEEYKAKKNVYVYFSASKGDDGKNWCPDCVKAAPVVEKALSLAPEGSTVIYCGVGNRDFWKDQSNDFRKHPQFKVTGVPTLLQIGTPKRLVEEQLMKEDLLQMFFEE